MGRYFFNQRGYGHNGNIRLLCKKEANLIRSINQIELFDTLAAFLIGRIVKPKVIIDEVKRDGHKFGREKLYKIMIKFAAPVMLFILLIRAFGLI